MHCVRCVSFAYWYGCIASPLCHRTSRLGKDAGGCAVAAADVVVVSVGIGVRVGVCDEKSSQPILTPGVSKREIARKKTRCESKIIDPTVIIGRADFFRADRDAAAALAAMAGPTLALIALHLTSAEGFLAGLSSSSSRSSRALDAARRHGADGGADPMSFAKLAPPAAAFADIQLAHTSDETKHDFGRRVGSDSMPPEKRDPDPDAETLEQNEKFRSAIDESAAEFVCPITKELPVDPVTAEDGHVYEREHIEEWQRGHDQSPVTKLDMGKKLVPAVQIKSAIEKLVRSGAITGDKAERWQQRIAKEDNFEELKREAEAGDTDAMNDAGVCYATGDGVPEDQEQALRWYERAAQLGSVRGLTNIAITHSNLGKPSSLWLADLVEAATRGDAFACVKLGGWYAEGFNDLSIDKSRAKRWYTKALACTTEPPDDGDKQRANDWLSANIDVEPTWEC